MIMSVDLTQSFNEAMDLKRVLIQLEESKEQIKKMQEKLKTASDGLIADYKIRSEKLVEDYRARVEEAAEKSRSRKAAYLERIGMKRAQRQLQLEELTERVEYLMKMEIPAKADSLIGEKRREELSELKKVIVAELHRMSSRTDRIYLHIASQLKRNPTAASEKFADVLEELKRTLDNLK